MTIPSIDSERIDAGCGAAALWPLMAERVQRWLAARGAAPQDAVWLLPYAALLPPARAALAARGGWQPRVETALTLAESLAPPLPAVAGAVSGDAVSDRLQAAALLRQLAWGRERERRDGAGFRHLAAQLADAANALVARAAALAPQARAAWWARLRALPAAAAGPGALEDSLLRVAIEWAALSPATAFDALHALRPSAWIVLRLGGVDALAESLLEAADVPALRLDADPDPADPFTAPLQGAAAAGRWPLGGRYACDDLEAEAHAAASLVCGHVAAGVRPLALITADRMLARRIRALLDGAGVLVSDETGWRLSTTAAAAQLMALLRAARADASRDDALEWIKVTPRAREPWVAVLERHWRRGEREPGDREAEAEAAWRDAQQPLAALRERRERPLSEWLMLVDRHWPRDPVRPDVQAVQRALRLGDADVAWLELAAAMRLHLDDFAGWVDEVLDTSNLEPPRDADAEVVLTPLSRALGRPFAHVVLPAADARTLGSVEIEPSLIGPGLARQLGLPSVEEAFERRRIALAQLLRADSLTVLRRRHEGIEPLPASPLVQALAADASVCGRPWPEQPWQPHTLALPRQRWQPVAPRAPQALPERLSASAVEALRDCPYRFFVRSVLGLAQADELEAEVDKRDFGNWMHLTLHLFHRDHRADADEAAQLRQAADAAAAQLGLAAAELLPFRASLERLLPDYLAWLAQRRAEGWHWQAGEAAFDADVAQLAPHRLHGRIDRIDANDRGEVEVIDYKTGVIGPLREKTREQPLEDTQLIFYAALLRAARPDTAALHASYLSLDDRDAPQLLQHADVAAHVDPLLDGLGADLAALRDGAPMRALGEGRVCDFCEARGLCRRDHRPAGPDTL